MCNTMQYNQLVVLNYSAKLQKEVFVFDPQKIYFFLQDYGKWYR